jgi:hypothetical protein
MIKKRIMPYSFDVSYNANPDDGYHMFPVFTLSFAVQNEDTEDLVDELRESLLKLVNLTIEILEEGEVSNG